jgi:hypothetical protein
LRRLRWLADLFDLSIADEAELRGVVKGFVWALLYFCALALLVPLLGGGSP